MHTFPPQPNTPNWCSCLPGNEQYFADVAMEALDTALGRVGISLASDDWELLHLTIAVALEEATVNKLHRNDQ